MFKEKNFKIQKIIFTKNVDNPPVIIVIYYFLVDPCPQNSITEVRLGKMQCIISFSFYNTSSVSKRSQILNLIQKLSSVSAHFDRK